MQKAEVPENVIMSQERYKSIAEDVVELRGLKRFLTDAQSIDDLLWTYKTFNIRPHDGLLDELSKKSICVDTYLLMIWEEEDAGD